MPSLLAYTVVAVDAFRGRLHRGRCGCLPWSPRLEWLPWMLSVVTSTAVFRGRLHCGRRGCLLWSPWMLSLVASTVIAVVAEIGDHVVKVVWLPRMLSDVTSTAVASTLVVVASTVVAVNAFLGRLHLVDSTVVAADADDSDRFTVPGPPSFAFAVLSTLPCLNETDELRLINAPEDVTKLCQEVIQSQYVLGVRRTQLYGTSLEFKLMGNPWSYGHHGHDGIHGRNLICHLISSLASRCWKPVISIDVSAKYIHQDKGEDYPLDVDSIFFTYDPTAVQETAPAPYAQPPPHGLLPQGGPAPPFGAPLPAGAPPPPFAPPAYEAYPPPQ
ncbi:hypothetical protein ACROYT_G014716 [Oculina patagonica]